MNRHASTIMEKNYRQIAGPKLKAARNLTSLQPKLAIQNSDVHVAIRIHLSLTLIVRMHWEIKENPCVVDTESVDSA